MTDYCSWCHQTDDGGQPADQPAMHNALAYPNCPKCSRLIKLITIRKACEVVSKSKKTIHEWMNKGLVSSMRSASGTPLICYSSLFVPQELEGVSIHDREGRGLSREKVSKSNL
jgi:hypothetical protein